MTDTVAPFGTTDDGTRVEVATLEAGPLRARVMGWGAALQDLVIGMPDGPRRIVLGFDALEDYIAHSPYFGATAGRYGGRIAGGRFAIDGTVYRVPVNEKGGCHLHGGPGGLGKRPWVLEEADERSALFRVVSPAGDNGYPGRLTVQCRYTLSADRVSIAIEAETDAPTPVNMLHHSYFNLDGTGDGTGAGPCGTVDDHRFEVAAARYVEADEFILPTGRLLPLDGSAVDFRTSRRIGDTPYDMNFAIAAQARPDLHRQGRVTNASGDLAVDVWSTEPGLHFYNGFKLDIPVPGLGGARYGPRAGLCLEPQRFADSPNQPGFPDTILRPGERYIQHTEYRFEQM